MGEITIRLAKPDDVEAVAAMVDAMDSYYRDPERPAAEALAAAKGWFRDGRSDTRFVLALAGDRPVGFAAFAVLHPGNDLQGLVYLKDVFVAAEARGRKVGERLMRYLAAFCRREGIGRIDWEVENPDSQRFYERLGAVTKPQKLHMRLDGQALADLAEDEAHEEK